MFRVISLLYFSQDTQSFVEICLIIFSKANIVYIPHGVFAWGDYWTSQQLLQDSVCVCYGTIRGNVIIYKLRLVPRTLAGLTV